MRGDLTLKVLKILKSTAVGLIDIADVLLGAGYGKSAYIRADSEKLRWKDLERMGRQRYYNLLYNLKKQGFIKEAIKEDKRIFVITDKGRKMLSFLVKRKKEELPNSTYSYESSSKFVIITFDVPEKEKRKREWLRSSLKHLGLKMVQKSVWLGKVKIPKEFLEDIRRLRLIEYLEIFEITKTGSLEHLA
jgi:DNA-binding transcriptional regulator PaaX